MACLWPCCELRTLAFCALVFSGYSFWFIGDVWRSWRWVVVSAHVGAGLVASQPSGRALSRFLLPSFCRGRLFFPASRLRSSSKERLDLAQMD